MNLVAQISLLLLGAIVVVSKKTSMLLVSCVHEGGVRDSVRSGACARCLCLHVYLLVCVPLCTLAVIIVSNNPNEERGTGCIQSSNYKLISYHVVGSN